MSRKISKELQDTVATHPNIDFVHFDVQGNHHFNVHEHKPTDKKDKTSGGLYARIHTRNLIDEDGRKFQNRTPIIATKIVESLTRKEILDAETTSNLEVNFSGLTDAEKEAIKKMRSQKGE